MTLFLVNLMIEDSKWPVTPVLVNMRDRVEAEQQPCVLFQTKVTFDDSGNVCFKNGLFEA